MDNLISVLIADDNADLSKVLGEYLGGCDDLIVRGIASDGLEAVNMIREHLPDVVILDLIMPNLDGIGVLEKINDLKLEFRPVFIVLSAIGQDRIIQKAVQLGADYYMVKPFDIDMLLKWIRQLAGERYAVREISSDRGQAGNLILQRHSGKSLEKVVTDLIRDLRILPNAAGFQYLREAVILSVENPALLVSAAKYLYPAIAERHNTTGDKVGRAIRCVIENSTKASGKSGEDGIAIAPGFGKKAPSTTEIVAILAEKARLHIEKSRK